MDERWSAVDAYFGERLLEPDSALDATRAENAKADLPAIDVSPLQGKLLGMLAKIHGARNVLEVGTLGGYSTIWLARALPEDGRVTTLEISPKHAAVARQNIDRAGVGAKVEVLVGSAAETLPTLSGPFDMAFIDADKPSNPIYWREALRLVRSGGIVIVDNVVRDGSVVDAESENRDAQGVRALLDLIHGDPRVEATAIQTVGQKGYDGFLIAIVS